MTLTPNFLPVGSVVEYNGKPRVITANDIHNCQADNNWFNNHYRPIPLTPKILTEWCDASNKLTEQYRIGNRLFIFRGDKCFDYGSSVQLDYLHELQLLFLGMKQVLTVTIK